MIRSSSLHELGVQLAHTNKYNSVNMLIDLYHYHISRVTINDYMSTNSYYKTLVEFVHGHGGHTCKFSMDEMENEAFYLKVESNGSQQVFINIYEWRLEDTFESLNLAPQFEKYIRLNRQTFDSLLKGTSGL